jgi:hypothetical protein
VEALRAARAHHHAASTPGDERVSSGHGPAVEGSVEQGLRRDASSLDDLMPADCWRCAARPRDASVLCGLEAFGQQVSGSAFRAWQDAVARWRRPRRTFGGGEGRGLLQRLLRVR